MKLVFFLPIFLKFLQVVGYEDHLIMAVNDLQTVSALVNGLHLQTQFYEKSFRLDALMAELLGFQSVDDFITFHTIRNIPNISKEIKSLEDSIKSFDNKSTNHQTDPFPGIRALRKMMSYWTMKETYTPQFNIGHLKRDIGKRKEAVEKLFSYLDNMKTAAVSLKTIFDSPRVSSETGITIGKLDETIRKINVSLPDVNENTVKLSNAFDKFLAEKLDEEHQISRAALDYKELFPRLRDLMTEYQRLREKEGSKLEELPSLSEMSEWSEFENSSLKIVNEEVGFVQVDSTFGLPYGLIDLQLLFTNLKRERFRKVIRNGEDTQDIEKLMTPLETVTIQATKLDEAWKNLKEAKRLWKFKRNNIQSFKTFGSEVHDTDIHRESGNVGLCGMHLQEKKQDEKKMNEDFNEFYDFLNQSESLIPNLVRETKLNIMNLEGFPMILEILDRHSSLTDHIKVYQQFTDLKRNETLKEFQVRLSDVSLGMENFGALVKLYKKINEILENPDLDKIPNSLNGTFLPDLLNCVREKEKSFKVVNSSVYFLDTIEVLNSNQSGFSLMKDILRSSQNVINQWKNLQKTFGVVRKQNHTVRYKMRNVEELAKNIEGGVKVLLNLRRVYQDRLLIEDLIEQGKKVKKDIAKVLNSTWTEENEEGIQKLLSQLIGLSYRSEDLRGGKDILKTGTIFQEAIRLKGVPIDMKTLIKKLTDHFGKSGGYEVQKFIGMLQRLEHLQLDYSSSSYPLKAAHHALLDVRKYFDELLGQSAGTTSTEIPKVTEVTEKVDKPILSVFEWIFVGMGVFALGGIALAVYYCITVPF